MEPTQPPVSGEGQTSLHLRNAARNDRASTAWIVSRFTPLLLCQASQRIPASLRRFCDADDLVADVWVAVLPRLSTLAPSDGSYSRGLLRLASTVLMRRLRDLIEKHVVGKRRVESNEAGDPVASAADADTRGVVTHVVAEECKSRVWSSLLELAPMDREILVLRGIEGHSHDEIALRTGLTPTNSAVRYHRALKSLRALIPMSVFDELEE